MSYKLLTEFEDKLPLTAKEVYGKVGKSVKTKQKRSQLLWTFVVVAVVDQRMCVIYMILITELWC